MYLLFQLVRPTHSFLFDTDIIMKAIEIQFFLFSILVLLSIAGCSIGGRYGGTGSDQVIITPTRIFSGPGQYPPNEFPAYGILAFPQHATPASRDRHLMICEQYVAAFPHATELPGTPKSKQMVTVWPIDNDKVAIKLDRYTSRENICSIAVDRYGLALASAAIGDAFRSQRHRLLRGDPVDVHSRGRGPFLLAWAPGSQKGASDAVVLVLDLTRVNMPRHAEAIFERWRREIEQDPSLWSNGWDITSVKLRLRLWADDMGGRTLTWFIKQ
jgi:hypothetical protein